MHSRPATQEQQRVTEHTQSTLSAGWIARSEVSIVSTQPARGGSPARCAYFRTATASEPEMSLGCWILVQCCCRREAGDCVHAVLHSCGTQYAHHAQNQCRIRLEQQRHSHHHSCTTLTSVQWWCAERTDQSHCCVVEQSK